ncbi:hypothetical protein [Bosea massiliensis]|uniref:Uncharacterized protein n=1 Tax=Bosea massiliensis TaxID=151419 RepID=A0ABW0P9X4_9HYPH
MKTNIPTITSFEGIALEATIRPVTDDLDGIARRLPLSGDRDMVCTAVRKPSSGAPAFVPARAA